MNFRNKFSMKVYIKKSLINFWPKFFFINMLRNIKATFNFFFFFIVPRTFVFVAVVFSKRPFQTTANIFFVNSTRKSVCRRIYFNIVYFNIVFVYIFFTTREMHCTKVNVTINIIF